MDLSKLTDEQLNLALKIAEEAKKQGVNPDFVLPMVMQESGFNPKAVSKAGAIGIMQLMPKTAESLGVDPNDVDQNIRGGVRLIKDLVGNKNIGNDPIKVLMGYNAGPDTKFFKTGNIEDLPNETVNHILSISNFAGGDLPSVVTETEEQVPTDEGERVAAAGKEDIPGYGNAIEPFLGIVGAGAGLGASTAIETTKKVAPLVPNILSRLGSGAPNPTQPMSRVGLQRYLNSQIAPNLKLPLSELEKVTGGEKIRTMSEVQNALTTLKGEPGERVAKTASIDPRTGTPRKVYSYTPGRPPIDLTPYEVPVKGPVASAVGRQVSTAADVARAVAPSVARVGLGGLGGAAAAMQGYDAYELYRKMQQQKAAGEEPSLAQKARLGTKSLATMGGGLSMMPFGATQAAGLAAMAPETVWSLLDYYRNTPPAAEGALPQENVYP